MKLICIECGNQFEDEMGMLCMDCQLNPPVAEPVPCQRCEAYRKEIAELRAELEQYQPRIEPKHYPPNAWHSTY